jgi:hypothetical protein
MDLSTITTKLKGGFYETRADFHDDFKLMINNALVYNGDQSRVGQEALAFNRFFDKGWARLEDFIAGKLEEQAAYESTLAVAALGQAPPAPGPTTIKLKAPKPPSQHQSEAASTSARPSLPPIVTTGGAMKIKLKPSAATAGAPETATKRPNVTFADVPRDESPPAPSALPTAAASALSALSAYPRMGKARSKGDRPAMPVQFVPDKARQILDKIFVAEQSYFFREPVPEALEACVSPPASYRSD